MKLADKLAGVEGVVARRDAIAEALADAFACGRAMTPWPGPAKRAHASGPSIEAWERFAAAALTAYGARDGTSDEEDVESAAIAADLLMQEREERRAENDFVATTHQDRKGRKPR